MPKNRNPEALANGKPSRSANGNAVLTDLHLSELPEILTLAEAAQVLRCSKAHVAKIVNGQVSGAPPIPVIVLGRRKLIRRASRFRGSPRPNTVVISLRHLKSMPAGAHKEQSRMRRRRYQSGSLKKRCGKWIGQWWEGEHRRNRVLGPISSMTKREAMEKLDGILSGLRAKDAIADDMSLGQFIEAVYYPFYTRKWKRSTAANNINRVNTHIVAAFCFRKLSEFRRDDLQGFLDEKSKGLSFSMVDHLRWDLKQIFEMAVAEDVIRKSPAALLFTPGEAKRASRPVMSIEEVKRCLAIFDLRERLILQLAIVAGMRPGEIFGLTWGRLGPDYADIRQRVYRGDIDRPKTVQSIRKAALSENLLRELQDWRDLCGDPQPEAWVFPSERGTPLSRDNLLRRSIRPKLASLGLGWVSFQILRRTHSTLMNDLGVEGKLVADQLGHSLDVNQNVYTRSPVERRKAAVERLAQALLM